MDASQSAIHDTSTQGVPLEKTKDYNNGIDTVGTKTAVQHEEVSSQSSSVHPMERGIIHISDIHTYMSYHRTYPSYHRTYMAYHSYTSGLSSFLLIRISKRPKTVLIVHVWHIIHTYLVYHRTW